MQLLMEKKQMEEDQVLLETQWLEASAELEDAEATLVLEMTE